MDECRRRVFCPIGTLTDKARLARLVLDVGRHTVPDLLRRPDTTTAERLAHRLLGRRVPDPGSRAAACCWCAAPRPPLAGPVLILDGQATGPAKNVVVMSEVSLSYAPAGRFLVAAAIPGPEALDPAITMRVREQLARWFESASGDWEHLRTDVIAHGQPAQGPPLHPKQPVALGDGVFVCGDHRDTASIQGTLFSGGRAAAVRHHLNGGAPQ